MIKRQGSTTEIRDPLVIALAEQLDLCSRELDVKTGKAFGCDRCPVKQKCCGLWNKEVEGKLGCYLRPYEFRVLSQRFYKLKLERDAAMALTTAHESAQ